MGGSENRSKPRHSGMLCAKIIPATAVDDGMRDRMWEIFLKYYTGITREAFDKDLSKKNHVIMVCDTGDNSIQGFSTIEIMKHTLNGRKFLAVFSGDTIVEKEYWRQNALHMAFLQYIVKLKLKNPFTPLYWFLISKGYKTYLLLSRNLLRYWPRYDTPTPEWENSMLDYLVREKYPEVWIPEKGVLHFEECSGKLKSQNAPITNDLLEFPDIKFFAEKNPGHVDGDELCCIGLIDNKQILSSTWKQGRRFLRSRRRK